MSGRGANVFRQMVAILAKALQALWTQRQQGQDLLYSRDKDCHVGLRGPRLRQVVRPERWRSNFVATTKEPSDAETYYYAAGQGVGANLRHALNDLLEGAKLYRTWGMLAWRDWKSQTRRTLLGPVWSIVGLGIQVAALGYVYGALLKTDPTEGYPYIAAGLILWFFISGSMLGGLSVYLGGAGVLKERSLPVSFTVYRYTFRLLAELCYKFILFVIVAALAGLAPNWNMALALPALLIFALNGLWVILLFGVIGARFRDVRELVSPLMLIAFLATPVLWKKQLLGGSEFIATYNPFTHYLAIMREPLLGHLPSVSSVAIVLALTVAGSAVAIAAFSLAKNRIVFWL